MKRETLTERYVDSIDCLLFLEPECFDDAIVGVAQRADGMFTVCYSEPKVIKVLMDVDKMSFEEALEFYNFNILGSYLGDATPVFVDDEQ